MFDEDIAKNADLATDAAKKFAQDERNAKKAAEEANTKLQVSFDAFKSAHETKVKELEDKNAAAEVAATDAAKKAAEDLAAAQLETTRWQVAHSKKIPTPFVEALAGSTKEEIEAKADSFKPYVNTTPQPDPSQGGAGAGETPIKTGRTGRELMAESIDIDI